MHGFYAPSSDRVYGTLNLNRERLEQIFDIPNEAAWCLFCEAFDSGFTQGYRVIKKGITVESHRDKITLLNE